MEPSGHIEPQLWMTRTETRAVMAALAAGGRPARFVGGCVRDALLGRTVSDVDIATQEPPERVIELLESAGLKALPTGIEHGTITAIAGRIPHEVTTLRHDRATDGRHATVAFTDDWAADAARRDFTFNALYADDDGTLYDPVGGVTDARAGCVRFVGDARTRITEDVLRLLRYFRFFAHYGRTVPDEAALAACREMAPKLSSLSVERIWSELRRLMMAPDPAATLDLMAEQGVLQHVLPEASSRRRLAALSRLETRHEIRPNMIRRLAAAIDVDEPGATALSIRLRMARAEARRLALLTVPAVRPNVWGGDGENRLALYRLGGEAYRDLALIEAAGAGLEEGPASAALEHILSLPVRAPVPAFPLAGRDIRESGVEEGPHIGALLDDIEAWWIEGGFVADRAACLDRLRDLSG